ncbi:MAG TPA: hypothetical protein VNL16_19715 [Chloroflexota bacterium]|nr:hypothetical protein [Chloroflexota bacterium]
MEEEKPRYYIDERWYTDHSKSFRAVALTRLCTTCRRKLGTEVQERVPTVDGRGRVVFEMRSVPFASSPLSVIRNDCSKQREYITPETPLAEAIFRVFLANSNQPTDVEGIREQLGNYISLASRPHGYAPELIASIVENDHLYGFKRFEMVPA